MKLRVLVVDDSILFRRAVADALAALPDVEVVGSAPNGKIALQKARELRPDLITLDMEMPELGGLEVLDSLRGSGDPAAVIVLSSLTSRGGKLTMQALEKGAFDFITKPDAPGAEESRKALRLELGPRLRALAHRLEVRAILRQKPAPTVTGEQTPPEPATRFMPAGLDSVEDRKSVV